MLTNIQTLIDKWRSAYPNGDEVIYQSMQDDEEISEEEREIINRFVKTLNDVMIEARRAEISTDKIIALFANFKCSQYAARYIEGKMNVFDSYKPLRALEKKDIYKVKVCVDLIWANYILRYDPYLDFGEDVPLDEKDFTTVAARLDRFTTVCIGRHYSETAICYELKKESDLSDTTCKYIAEKINSDFEKLKLNYIIDKMVHYEHMIKDRKE